MRHVLDCISDELSVRISLAALSRSGGRYACLEYIEPELATRKAVEMQMVLGYEIFGREISLGANYSRLASKEKRENSARYMKAVQRAVENNELRSHPVRLLSGGLEAVQYGLDMLRRGEVSGEKLVVRVR